MSCYKCGSPEGNEARLCPACTEARMHRQAEQKETILTKPEDTVLPATEIVKTVAIGVLAAIVLGCVSYILFFHASKAPHEKAYAACMKKVESELGKAGSKMKSQAKSDAEAAFANAFAEMFTGIGASLCEEIKKECETNPDGQKCRSLIKAF